MTAYFNEKFIGEGKVQGIDHVRFSGKRNDLTVDIYAQAAGRPILISMTGKLEKGPESQPVKYTVNSLCVGCIPLSFAKDKIAERFAPLTKVDVVSATFAAAEKAEFKDGKLQFTFAKKAMKKTLPSVKSQTQTTTEDSEPAVKKTKTGKKSKKSK